MSATGTGTWQGKNQYFSGVATTNANDVAIETNDVQQWDTFMLMSQSGALQVLVSLDGTNFSTAALSLTDLGAITTTPVTFTAANRVYGFRGKFYSIRITQNGAAAVTSCQLRCGRMGG